MSLLPNGYVVSRPQMQLETQQPKLDASGQSGKWLQARSPLSPSGQLSQPAAQLTDPMSGKQAGTWPPAMPTNSSPHQLRLKAHPLTWFPKEEPEEDASCATTKEEGPAVIHATPLSNSRQGIDSLCAFFPLLLAYQQICPVQAICLSCQNSSC